MLTARQELQLQARLYGLGARQARERTDELLRAFELTDCAERAIGTLSGGQRRRLDLTLGLVHRPQLVFLDEPTTGLDPQARARLWDEVRRLSDEGTTVFLTTHYLDEADALCDRLAIIDHGRIVSEGTADELKRQIAGDVVAVSVQGDAEAARAAGRPAVRARGDARGQPAAPVRRPRRDGAAGDAARARRRRSRRADPGA